jgi:hypothetical protein
MTELCFNLWYYLNEKQLITAIAARAYFLEGADDDKSAILSALSKHDYKITEAYPPPEELRRQHRNGLNYAALKDYGIDEVYKEVFAMLRRSLPKDVAFPNDKLFLATPLYDFGHGFVPARIADGFVTER